MASKDYWRKRREKEEWFRSVDIKYLFQFQTLTKELERYAKNNPHPGLKRYVDEFRRIYAGMSGEVTDFDLKKERLPEDKDGIFSSAVLSAKSLSK